ncbi:hypothetical protein [Maricaulis parjimensis]|uniref:hypothetical protein n=1 Tax=Maricaulis parjimensis TaxID=144023 RepID=UPI00193A6E8B|nr:hypothetical protein [Maricaulis parjimensis]
MPRLLAVLICSLVLTACEARQPSDIGEQALALGDWGWENGAGCTGERDLIRFSEERIDFIRDGETVHTSPLYERELVHAERMAGVDGRLESTFWTWYRLDENGEALFVRDRYSVRYLGGEFRGLTFASREERPADGGRFRRVRGDHLPDGTLMPCTPAAP